MFSRATRIGVVGFVTAAEPLFSIAAQLAGKERKCAVRVVWLAGVNNHEVDARIVNKQAAVMRGKANVEIEVSLAVRSTADAVAAIRNGIIECLDRLA